MDIKLRNIHYLLHHSILEKNPYVEAKMVLSALTLLIAKIEEEKSNIEVNNLKLHFYEFDEEEYNKDKEAGKRTHFINYYRMKEIEINDETKLLKVLKGMLHSLSYHLLYFAGFDEYFEKESQPQMSDVESQICRFGERFHDHGIIILRVITEARVNIFKILAHLGWDKIEFTTFDIEKQQGYQGYRKQARGRV